MPGRGQIVPIAPLKTAFETLGSLILREWPYAELRRLPIYPR
jgi:hypothetical protein